MLLIMPFENASDSPGLDWIGEAFPEVLSTRLTGSPLFIISRHDRLSAFDQLGLPAAAKPSRATIYQLAQALDADYVLMGDYRYDGKALSARAQIMDMGRLRLGPEMKESGPLASLIQIQTSLAWDVLNELKLTDGVTREQFAAQFQPMQPEALENYVRGMIATSDEEKIKRFKLAASVDPANTLAILQLGKAFYSVRDYHSAVSWLEKVSDSDPNYNQAQFYLGLSAFYGNELDKAEAAFRALSLRLPLTEVLNNLGVVSARLGQGRALGYFQKTVRTDPNDPDYRFNLAVELFKQGDSQSAAREARAAISLHSDAEAKSLLEAINSGTTPARMPLQRIKSNYDESEFRQLALEIANTEEARLRKLSPVEHAAFHVQRGEELLEQGVTSEAEKQFREAVILDPTNAGAHTGLARILELKRDFAAARNEAAASLRLKPLPETYVVLARLDMAEKNFAGAEQNVDKALALDPADAAAAALKHDLAAARSKQEQE
jgi:tetratricopeptide (TPR) repeat protein